MGAAVAQFYALEPSAGLARRPASIQFRHDPTEISDEEREPSSLALQAAFIVFGKRLR
jgi:hypothetical protein